MLPLALLALSNFMGDDLRNVLNRKSLWTGSSHVNTDCSDKVRRVEAFGVHRIVLPTEKTYCFQNSGYRNLIYSTKQR